MLLKLVHAGVHGKMFKWLNDFLFNGTARVKVDGMICRQVSLREGVPQGGVVSPALFLVYINGITTTEPRRGSNTQHADDFAVLCAEEHTTTAVHQIQNTINDVVFLSCPLVKKHADLSGSFLYSQSRMKDMYSKPTNRTELSIPMKTIALRSHSPSLSIYIQTEERERKQPECS